MLSLGFDFGSLYAKAVLLDAQGQVQDAFYRRRAPGEVEALAAFLEGLEARHAGLPVRVGATGGEGPGALGRVAAHSNGILAVGAGVRAFHPGVRNIIEVGGQTAKYLVLEADGSLKDFATNEACAAGTGAFLEQQARRLGLSAQELSRLAAQAGRAATIAGRCSVFAASDMIHLQQKGAPLAEIAYGLCTAIARNYLATLLKGREAGFPVVIAGGCAHSEGILRAFRDLLAQPGDAVVAGRHPGLEGALGAALGADPEAAVTLGAVKACLSQPSGGPAAAARSYPPLRPARSRPRAAEPEGGADSGLEGFLGIDVGSVSTDLVVLDPGGNVLSSVYLPTRGLPAEVLLEGLAALDARFRGRLRVLGCGATGSGRHLAGKLLGADLVKNEITCQLLGARHFVPDVDTILEIGGQDSKFIRVRDGAMTDFAMNKVCAAGTGSFLEERSRDLGIDIRGAFAARAFAAAAPLDLGSRCTVFMETEVVGALARGGTEADVCAGLAYSIVRNYLDKVVGTRPLGRRIVFQGGVASNEAVVAAFESVLGQEILVHPYNRISGAVGAALAARAAVRGPTAFKGFHAADQPRMSSFECRHCPNRCEVNVIQTGDRGEKAFFGDTCERYTSGGPVQDSRLPDLAAEYLERATALFDLAPGPGLRIGVPRASSMLGDLPFWATFWRELGHQPVLSGPTSQRTLALGLKHLPAGVCLPVKLAAGHIHALLEQEVDLVFAPAVTRLPAEDPAHAHACPYTMAVPFIIGVPGGARCLTPVVDFRDAEAFADGFEPWRGLGSRDRIRDAYRAGLEAQEALQAAFRLRARDQMAAGGHRHVFGVLGRPYGLYDNYLNLGLFDRFRRLGVLAVPMAFLPPAAVAGTDLPWRHPDAMVRAAAGILLTPGIHPVILSSYGCGPDAFTLHQLGQLLRSRPHLILELDEHRGEAGLMTRVEAFLDQLGERPGPRPRPLERTAPVAALPGVPSTIRIPRFADHAHAYCGLLRHLGHDARVLPDPGPDALALGEKYALGKECHAYAMVLGDLLKLAERAADGTLFFFPGTSLPCLLHEYGREMQALLGELGIGNVRVCSPRGDELLEAAGLKRMERFYAGLLAIELLVKAVCQIRPYELEPGATDRVHQANLERIEDAVAAGDVLAALDRCLAELARVPVAPGRDRPKVGLVGDMYTRVNPVANQDLVRWLEQQGLEVWPAPFQIDILDFGISRNLFQSLTTLDLPNLLASGSMALLRALHHHRVRSVAGPRVARQEEPGYLELKRLAAPYMPNEAHELLFLHVAKTVDFARAGADGIANAVCFGCMVGNAAAAVNDRIRRDFEDIPMLTAVFAGGADPARSMALEAFVGQVKARHSKRAARPAQGGGLLARLLGP
jgi:predicted CoA-substrate-specific enzyme activase